MISNLLYYYSTVWNNTYEIIYAGLKGILLSSSYADTTRYFEGSIVRKKGFVNPKMKKGSLIIFGKPNLRNNATNVRINEPYFIFGLTNLHVYDICVFVITNLRNNEPHPWIWLLKMTLKPMDSFGNGGNEN